MAANSFADTVVNGMLSWLKGFANWVLRLFDLAGSGGVSPLEWLSGHWLQLLVVLLIIGVAADIIVWLVRWRPYWVCSAKSASSWMTRRFLKTRTCAPVRALRRGLYSGRIRSFGGRRRGPCPSVPSPRGGRRTQANSAQRGA